MTKLLWLSTLPSTDDAFIPLHRLEWMCDGAEYPLLARAHRQAFIDASWGHPMEVLEERAAELHAHANSQVEHAHWPDDEAAAHRDALEAQGYALGVTAVRVAMREHSQDDMAGAA